MQLSSVTVYGNMPGHIIIDLGNNAHTTFALTEEEAVSLRVVAERIVEARQSRLVEAMTQPFAALANFSEA